MRKAVLFLLAIIGIFGCGGGGSAPPASRREAVDVTLTAQRPPAAPLTVRGDSTGLAAVTNAIEAQATNVGDVTVRGFIFTHYDGGGGNTPATHDLLVCQKCFDFKDNTGLGGCNFIFHCYEEENCDFESLCKQGFYEHYYMDPGEGYCDNAAEHPDLDCSRPTWRVLTLPIVGFAGGGGKLDPGESMNYGAGYTYAPGTYSPSAAVYRWDGALFDNDAKTLTVE